jgi:hypothetical protein
VVGEIEDRIYEAALLITKSAMGIKASVRIYSTMHKAYGLMNKVVSEAAESGYRVYKWCIFCIMEKCIGRDCDTCELWEDCGGRARQADGFYPVEDAISAKRKVSREAWESEMLCRMPSQEEADLQGIRFIGSRCLGSEKYLFEPHIHYAFLVGQVNIRQLM